MSKDKYKIDIVFFGTPDYVIPILDTLNKEFRGTYNINPISAVVTQEPKPSGRDQRLNYSAVDSWAHKKKLPIYHSAKELLNDGTNAKLGILASYGEIISKEVLNLFPNGILNIHPSLLPEFRGAAPVQAAIISENQETGVSIIKMDDELDHGPVVSSFEEKILVGDTTESLRARLFEKSSQFLVDLIPNYIKGKIKLKPQNDSDAIYTRQLTKDDGYIPPQFLQKALDSETVKEIWPINFIRGYETVPTPENIDRFIRAVYPWPGAWTYVVPSKGTEQQRLKILRAHVEFAPQTQLYLDEVQLEGKTSVAYREFMLGYPDHQFKEVK